ncbi:restriction endonuclease subunit S [Methylobacterium sp. PvR107]|uniref:restriction endonuclease subunit S n=1 Tax=Methylobacterium sp. PvR107 TaxID=2806597 RepID=UPI001AE67B2F|nr:restriction endonuclease subunit S [Methylobacterium sp. PvR107]MBP1180934.1 type I restriction enzyme S subunit [Methylobacterium sp. PvR107]
MSKLPVGWSAVRLGDVCELINGRAYKQDELLESGKYPVLRVGNFFSNKSWYYSNLELEQDKYCDDGDLLYAWSASFGPRIWEGGKTIFHYHIWKTRCAEHALHKQFLYYWFDWDKKNIQADHGTGSTMIHVTKGDMEARSLSLPPLPEQRRIVSKIDTLSANSKRVRSHLSHVPRLVELYKKSVVDFALRGDLTRTWRANLSDHGKWKTLPAAELFRWSSGKNLTAKAMRPGAIPVLGGNGINGYHDTALVDFPTIVIGRVGAQCGNVHLSRAPAWITDNAIYASSFSQKIISLDYAVMVFRHADLNARAGGSGQPYVNQSVLNAVNISLPTIKEQAELIRRVEKMFAWIDRLAAEATSASKLIDRLDQAILSKAFRGELVPQDPDDEPASVLLERIKAERTGVTPARRGRGRPRLSAAI